MKNLSYLPNYIFFIVYTIIFTTNLRLIHKNLFLELKARKSFDFFCSTNLLDIFFKSAKTLTIIILVLQNDIWYVISHYLLVYKSFVLLHENTSTSS